MIKKKRKSFIQWLLAIFALMFLSVVTVMSGISTAYAANINGLSVNGLTASYDNGTWSGSGTTISGSVKTSSSSGCTGTTYTATTGTLTLTNNSGEERTLSFSGSVTLNSGTCKLEGSDWSGASFSKVLADGASASLVISSNPSGDGTTSVQLTSITLKGAETISVTFKAPTNGSYTVDGTPITSQQVISKLSTQGFAVVATPASGYKFFGWKNETTGQYISKVANTSLLIQSNCAISPVFLPSSTAVWDVSGETFIDLDDAITYANANTNRKTICLIENGTLPSGNYTISSGKTLLIPMDDVQTVVTDTPTVVYGSHTTPSAFRLLTMANGASITVANGGAICCAGKLCTTGQLGGWNGCTTGPAGRINMQSGSTITLQSGGKLYAWGYIYGSGQVEALSGATVHEAFQVKDWRGGTATSNCYSYTFIFNQYYIQNIEVPLKLNAGSTEKLYSSVNASSSGHPMGATFLGSGGLFNLSSGYLIKDYIESTDRLQVDIYGQASITSMSITGLPLIGSISTSDYEMPITSNISINVHSGTTTISQNVKFLPSTELTIDPGAFVEIGSNYKAYVYDNDDWLLFTGSARLYVIGYSVANGTTAKRTAAGLVDAKIDVNGTLNVKGNLYTSAGGANITSSQGGGQVVCTKAPGTADSTIYEMASNSTKTGVTFNPARLHNGSENDYTATAGSTAGTKYAYCKPCEKWYILNATYSVAFNANGGTGSMSTHTHSSQGHYDYSAPACGFTAPDGQAFAGWNTEADGSGTQYAVGDTVHVSASITLYAQWEQVSGFTITWENYDGAVLKIDEDVEIGATPTYTGATPTRPSDAQYTYTFSGWTPTIVPATSNATYTATYSTTVNTYTVTWKNYNGATLETDTGVAYGTTAHYDGSTPTKPSDAQNTYTFVGWAASANGTPVSDFTVTRNAEYYAVFSEIANTYTITWMNYDGTLALETDENVPYGSAPSYNGSEPTKPSTAQYSYSFIGWATSVNQTSPITLTVVTGNATYYPVFEEHLREYNVTFKNDDGTTLDTITVAYGETPTYSGATPAKAATAQYTYTFAGWAPAITAVTGDATYTATYTSTINTYTITWQNEDGTILETDNNVAYGTMPSYDGATPTKAATAQYTYAFSGWTPTVSAVTGDMTYTATYTETVNTYTVIWKNGDTTLETDNNVAYGSHPSYDGTAPTKAASGQDRYSFIGWSTNPDDTYGVDGSVFTVTGDVTYYAIFGEYHVGLYRDSDGYVRLHDMEGNLKSDVTGIFHYSSSDYPGIGDNNYYYLVNGVVQEGYGLVALQENSTTYLFYILEDGTILKPTNGCTFYVAKTNGYTVNGITVQSGLYYFDTSGHMYFGNSLLTGDTEFGVISSNNASIGGGH